MEIDLEEDFSQHGEIPNYEADLQRGKTWRVSEPVNQTKWKQSYNAFQPPSFEDEMGDESLISGKGKDMKDFVISHGTASSDFKIERQASNQNLTDNYWQ